MFLIPNFNNNMLLSNMNNIFYYSTQNNESLIELELKNKELELKKLELDYNIDRNNIDRNNNNSPDNSFINSPLEENDLFFFINSPLEQYSDLQLYVIAMIIINFGILLLTFLILINIIIKLFKLEDKEFIKNKPKLYKITTLSLKVRDYTSLFMIVFILFGSSSMLIGLSYLLHFFKLLNL